MNTKTNQKIKNIAHGAVIASIYTACSLLPGISAISYGPIQLRISEALMLLCLFSPSSVFGVSIGCFLANVFTPFGANFFDLVFGTGATIIAAYITYILRDFFLKHVYLAPLPTIVLNSIIVGSYLPIFITESNIAVWYCISSIGIGEAVVCYVLGLPLAKFCERKGFFDI